MNRDIEYIYLCIYKYIYIYIPTETWYISLLQTSGEREEQRRVRGASLQSSVEREGCRAEGIKNRLAAGEALERISGPLVWHDLNRSSIICSSHQNRVFSF